MFGSFLPLSTLSSYLHRQPALVVNTPSGHLKYLSRAFGLETVFHELYHQPGWGLLDNRSAMAPQWVSASWNEPIVHFVEGGGR